MIKPSFIKSIKNLPMTLKDWVIEIFCYNRVSRFLRRFGRFILREIRWIPVLWNQEDWDFEYMYDLLEVKMKELNLNDESLLDSLSYADLSKADWEDVPYETICKLLKKFYCCDKIQLLLHDYFYKNKFNSKVFKYDFNCSLL